MFGGTSMSAPIVSGSAALVIQSLNDQSLPFTPQDVKNILMSTANDIGNDPFTQGTGMVNSLDAIRFTTGEGGVFQVSNIDSYRNLDEILKPSLSSLNYTKFGLENHTISLENIPQTSWFGGRINPGDETSTIFKITNPTNNTITIDLSLIHI